MSDNVRWNLIDIFKVFLFYFLMMQVGIPAFLWVVNGALGLNLIELFGHNFVVLGLSLVVNVLTCVYVFYIIRVGYGSSIKSLGFTTDDWKSDVLFGLKHYFVVLPVIILAGFVVDYFSRMLGVEPDQQEILKKVLGEKSIPVLTLIVFFGIVVAPVIEELVFRGFFQSAIRTAFGKQKAIIISGLIFAIVHLDAQIFLQIFILGLLLAYLFEKTGSLIAPIAVHFFHNSATLAFVISFKYFADDYAAVSWLWY